MSDLHIHTETSAPKRDTATTIGKTIGVVLVSTLGVLTVSLIVWGIVAVWRNILGG